MTTLVETTCTRCKAVYEVTRSDLIRGPAWWRLCPRCRPTAMARYPAAETLGSPEPARPTAIGVRDYSTRFAPQSPQNRWPEAREAPQLPQYLGWVSLSAGTSVSSITSRDSSAMYRSSWMIALSIPRRSSSIALFCPSSGSSSRVCLARSESRASR